MGFLDKVHAKLVRKALNIYLPTTKTEIVSLRAPISTPALRVWQDQDLARDYFVYRRTWWVVPAEHPSSAGNTFSTGPMSTSVGANTGSQVISAVIASHLTGALRPQAYPLASDFYSPNERDSREEARARFEEPYGFLMALANGRIPNTDGADRVAALFVDKIDGEIQQHRTENEPTL